MDAVAIASAASAFSAAQTGDAVQVSVLRKALDAEAQGAAALINALPQPARLPDHLGQHVNTTA